MKIQVRKFLRVNDIAKVGRIAFENFSGMKPLNKAHEWIHCADTSSPAKQYFVAVLEGDVIGYILWTEHGGFREEAFIELEQMAITKELQGNGFGPELMVESLGQIKDYLKRRGSYLKVLKVTTEKENVRAKRSYIRHLGVKIENTVDSPYHEGKKEVEMFARFSKPQ